MRTPTDQEAAVLDALVDAARPVIRTEFRADSCIASTRIGIDALAYFGIRAVELPVSVLVFNADAAALVSAGVTLEDLREQTRAIPVERPGGPWTIGVGMGTGLPGAWPGHLIVTVPEIGVICDLSIDQAARPQKDLPLESYWTHVGDPAWWGQVEGADPFVQVRGPHGAVLMVDRRLPDPYGYRSSPNWTKKPGSDRRPVARMYQRLTGQVIRDMRARLTG